jgi:quinol monooxygenase YgiN
MAKITLIVKLTTQPGKRDALKKIWEKETKKHTIENDLVEQSCYCFDKNDENTVWLFEIIKDEEVLSKLSLEPWFRAYLAEMQPILAAPPMITTADPVWIKKE